jgi:hypothetical protein
MSIMQSKANDLYWATQGVNATMKRKLFLDAFIEIHNIAVEDSAGEIQGASQDDIDAILRLRIEVPEE